jgi:hypothetical protein
MYSMMAMDWLILNKIRGSEKLAETKTELTG